MKTKSKVQFTLLTLLMLLTIPFSAYAVDGQIMIGQTSSTTFPITISQSGSYVLTSDLAVINASSVISIEADNVTLNLNGFAIIGTGLVVSTGIFVGDYKNTTIMNGTLCDLDSWGIYLSTNSQNTLIKDMKICDIGSGPGTAPGVKAQNAIIKNCVVFNTYGNGIEADNCVITNCSSSHSQVGAGFVANKCVIENCLAYNNFVCGFYLADGSTATNCTASYNQGSGFITWYSTVKDCTAYYNDNHGIQCNSGSRIEGNNLRSNGQDSGTTGYGIYANWSYIIKNLASNNDATFHDSGGSYMPICGVDAIDNCNYGY